LGYLLRRCARVAVRDGEQMTVVAAERLIGWRALQIVLGTPYLPGLDQLRQLYPEIRLSGGTLVLPLGLVSAEEVLAACAAARLPVAATRIGYLVEPPSFG
ncbi:MAG: hypothetical protein M3Q75_11730, partial [Gemmatimonadota bacterium]|nr:hypothetical protein [Gemmatimonadota bacterium]